MKKDEKINRIATIINDAVRTQKKGPLTEDDLEENKLIAEGLVNIFDVLREPST